MSNALLSYEEAAAAVAGRAAKARQPAVEWVELEAAQGRVLAQTLRADRDQPPFARSTRDGYSCRARECSKHGWLAIAGASRAGDAPAGPLPEGAAWEIMTGAPVPAGADAVIMLEHVELAGGQVRLLPPRTSAEGENIVAQGAQARAGDELLAAGSAMEFAQVALAATCGSVRLEVFAKPRVAILCTGDEIVAVEAEPAPGQIRNSNGPMLAALTAEAGGEPWVLPGAGDNVAALEAALERAAEADLMLISGGVSAGKFDLVEPRLARMGARFHFTGVRMQPGKPLVFGELPGAPRGDAKQNQNGTKFFFGLPGNPVSSAVTFLLFAAPMLRALGGRTEQGPRFALARLKESVKGKAGLTRFLPAACTFSAAAGETPEVRRVEWQGSGDLAAMARSNCFLVLAEDAERVNAGDTVRILLW